MSADSGKISGTLGCGRSDRLVLARDGPNFGSLPGNEEEGVVLFHRAAQAEAILVALQAVVGRSEKVPGVEIVVPDKLESRTMKVVSAAARGRIDYATPRPPNFAL